MTQEILKQNISELSQNLASKEFSALELTNSYIEEIQKHNSQINAFVEYNFEQAREQAKASDKRIAENNIRELEGIPMGVKDIFCTKGIRTTAASKMLENFIPSYESTVTSKLWAQGAIHLGKLNMDEFAMGSNNTHSNFGPVINPYSQEESLSAGGSSGGSAASVAANMCVASLGSDTGGSVRQPASYNGVVGVRPTYGRCSRYGIISFASSLDQAGVLARNVKDSAIILENICGYDSKDSTSINRRVSKWSEALNLSQLKGKKIGIPKEYNLPQLSPAIREKWQEVTKALQSFGIDTCEISLPHTEHAIATYYIIVTAEASSNLARYDGVRYGHRTQKECANIQELYSYSRAEGFGTEVKKRIMLGAHALSSGCYNEYYRHAQQMRQLITNDFTKAFEEVDFILTPSTTSTAPKLSEIAEKKSIDIYLDDIFLTPSSLAGLPSISVPVGNINNLPVGIHAIGNYFCEENLFNLANAIEESCL